MPPQLVMVQMVTGSWLSQCIYAAAKLGIADLLKNEPKSCDELANSTGTDSRSLYRLMRALASVGVFVENEQGLFALTPLATYLQSDVPGSIRAMAIMFGEEHYRAWGDILHSIQTGGCAFEHVYGMNVFDYYAQNPEPARIFDEAMTSFSAIEKTAVAADYDFSRIHKLVDVAGGHGSLIASILKSNPNMKGILFDQASVIAGAKPLLEAEGVSERCELVSGDFFESVPAGGDAYILKHIVHDWDDERAIAILKNCHQAMVENGKLLVVEQVIPPGNEPFVGKFLDLNMLMVAPGGCERTEAEYQTLFERAGFKLTKIVPTHSDVSVIEAIRA
ncbi:MAG: methyltransferase [Aphanothece sp. CMT-3BRIN-NPC111]|nr:methyltransferase [Aphanothece sp. CMT-3BRIN-NPC111]